MVFSRAAFDDDLDAFPVLAALDRGKWRKARDAAKLLCKKNRDRYLPLVIEANVQLLHEMAKKGQLSEAGTVLDHLRTIAPETLCDELQTVLQERQQQATPSTTSGGRTSASPWETALAAFERTQESGDNLEDLERLAVDALVTGEAQPSGRDDHPLAPVLRSQLEIVQQAITATGEGAWESAKTLLKEIPAKSVFRHWRLFLRGVRHSFLEESGAAAQCFERLPAGGACAEAAAVMMGRGVETKIDKRHLAAWWLAASGTTGIPALAMAKADDAWSVGSWKKCLELLNPLMQPYWKGLEGSLAGVMANLLFPSNFEILEDNPRRVREFDRHTTAHFKKHVQRAGMEAALMRCVLTFQEEASDREGLDDAVAHYISLFDICLGPNSIRENVAYRWLGDWAASPDLRVPPFLLGTGPVYRDARLARHAYEQALAKDPGDRHSAIALVDLLGNTGEKPARNRLLDELTKRMPEDKAVLLRAGQLAAERGALKKGIQYLQTAHQADPLDPAVRADLIRTYLKFIKKRKKQKKDPAQEWAAMEAYAFDHPAHEPYLLSRWSLRLRRSLETCDAESAQQLHEEAFRLAPHTADCLLLEYGFLKADKQPVRRKWHDAWKKVQPATFAEFRRARQVIEHLLTSDEAMTSDSIDLDKPVREAFSKALAEGLLTKQPMETRRFHQEMAAITRHIPIPMSLDEDAHLSMFYCYQIDDTVYDLMDGTDQLHPALKLLYFQNMAGDEILEYNHDTRQALTELVDQATGLNLPEIVKEANELTQRLIDDDEGFPAPQLDEPFDDEPFNEADAPPLDPTSMEFIQNLMVAVFKNDRQKLKQLKKELIANGGTPEDFEKFVAEIKKGPGEDSKSAQSDSNDQLNLF